jgi:hypothetical protein
MAKLTKEEFFALRDKQRELGSLKVDYTPENYENDLLPSEEEIILAALNGQKSGVFRTKDLGLTGLLCVEIYMGRQIKAQRKKIDELDNVTVWRISND